jgi:hypothetical protein
MTFDIEVVLKDRIEAVTDRVFHGGNNPGEWTEADVAAVLKSILLAIGRAKDPAQGERHIALRGFSWIVEPTAEGVVIAIEIPMGAAVAGPFDIPQARLDALITRVVSAARSDRPAIH